MQDITPQTWTDGSSAIDASTMNTEIRNSYMLILNPPTCTVHRAAALSIPNGASWTTITWDTLVVDTGGPSDPMYSSSAPTRITCKTPGYYEALINIGSAPPLGVTISYAARVNGTTQYALGSNYGYQNIWHRVTSAGMLIPLTSSTDYIEVQCVHSYTSAVNIEIAAPLPTFTLYRKRGI